MTVAEKLLRKAYKVCNDPSFRPWPLPTSNQWLVYAMQKCIEEHTPPTSRVWRNRTNYWVCKLNLETDIRKFLEAGSYCPSRISTRPR